MIGRKKMFGNRLVGRRRKVLKDTLGTDWQGGCIAQFRNQRPHHKLSYTELYINTGSWSNLISRPIGDIAVPVECKRPRTSTITFVTNKYALCNFHVICNYYKYDINANSEDDLLGHDAV
jgi:hypothetical protein